MFVTCLAGERPERRQAEVRSRRLLAQTDLIPVACGEASPEVLTAEDLHLSRLPRQLVGVMASSSWISGKVGRCIDSYLCRGAESRNPPRRVARQRKREPGE